MDSTTIFSGLMIRVAFDKGLANDVFMCIIFHHLLKSLAKIALGGRALTP